MEGSELDESMNVLERCLTLINWKLKPCWKRRLELDIVALCTRMRAVVMVDYGGMMPQLEHHLCSLLQVAQKESPIFDDLRVMVIQDMIYLIHVTELGHHAASQQQLFFVDLHHDPPKMITRIEESQLGMQLLSIRNLFSTIFSPQGIAKPSSSEDPNSTDHIPSHSTNCIHLSNCMDNTEVTIPTLNGWLLGYPVVYLFDKDHIADAIYNLSTKYLHIFQVFVRRNSTLKKGTQAEELLSFSVPYDISMKGSNEEWAQALLAHMQAKWERCPNAWKSLKMENTSYCIATSRVDYYKVRQLCFESKEPGFRILFPADALNYIKQFDEHPKPKK